MTSDEPSLLMHELTASKRLSLPSSQRIFCFVASSFFCNQSEDAKKYKTSIQKHWLFTKNVTPNPKTMPVESKNQTTTLGQSQQRKLTWNTETIRNGQLVDVPAHPVGAADHSDPFHIAACRTWPHGSPLQHLVEGRRHVWCCLSKSFGMAGLYHHLVCRPEQHHRMKTTKSATFAMDDEVVFQLHCRYLNSQNRLFTTQSM